MLKAVDNVPPELRIDSAPGCTISGQQVSCDIAPGVARGGVHSLTIQTTLITAPVGSSIVNTAQVQNAATVCLTPSRCTSDWSLSFNAAPPATVKEIPTLGPWLLLMLSGLMVLAGASSFRRRG